MHHQIDFAPSRRLERAVEVGEEIWAAAAPLDPRAQRQIEAEVGVGHEQDAEVAHSYTAVRRSTTKVMSSCGGSPPVQASAAEERSAMISSGCLATEASKSSRTRV